MLTAYCPDPYTTAFVHPVHTIFPTDLPLGNSIGEIRRQILSISLCFILTFNFFSLLLLSHWSARTVRISSCIVLYPHLTVSAIISVDDYEQSARHS